MKRVSAHVFATVMVSLALFGFTNAAVYASFNPHPNPNNRGHHYGWYKHNHAPVPVPPPNPGPTPAPVPVVTSTGTADFVTQSHPSHVAQTATGRPSSGLQLNLPVSNLVPAPQPDASNVKLPVPVGGDPWWWLVLLLPPALAALWGIAFRRLVINGAASRAEPAAGVA